MKLKDKFGYCTNLKVVSLSLPLSADRLVEGGLVK
jgi:hypothetical protein